MNTTEHTNTGVSTNNEIGGDYVPKRPPHPKIFRDTLRKRLIPLKKSRKLKMKALLSSNTVAGPASIAELSRALRHDVDLIFEWVYSNVDFYPMFGLHRSPLGTILDRSGNSFEQSNLMVALLREAGHTASFVEGVIRLTKSQLENLLGTDDSTVATTSEFFISTAQIPYAATYTVGGVLDYIDLVHFWVSVNIGGIDYVFDPSVKSYQYQTGIDLAAAVDYSEIDLIDAAEEDADVQPTYIKDLNRDNIRAKFKEYGTNLLDWIRENKFDASMEEIIGGRTIEPLPSTPLRQISLPYEAPGYDAFDWEEIPEEYRTYYNIVYQGINEWLDTSTFYGHRLTISYNSSNRPELRVDGALVATGNVTTLNAFYTATFTMDHPFFDDFADTSSTKRLYAPGTYFLGTTFGPISEEMVDYHRGLRDLNLANGAADGSESVLGESLAMLYYAQQGGSSQVHEVYHWIANCERFIFHSWGVTQYNTNFQCAIIDLQDNFRKGVVSREGDTVTAQKVSTACELIIGAFEGGVMQQNFPTEGVATAWMLDAAVMDGQKIFDANVSNWGSSTSAYIRSQLVNWTPSLSNLDASISASNRVIIHEDGATSVGSWLGGGYHECQTGPNGTGISGIINGQLSGGGSGGPNDGNPPKKPPRKPPRDEPETEDPVGMSEGAFYCRNTDLMIGSSNFPYQLVLGRSYSSANFLTDGPLGKGWTHNFASALSVISDASRGTGKVSPKEGAATIAHSFIMIQLALNSANSPSLTKLLIGSLSSRWLMDQMTNNCIVVSAMSENRSFLRLVDDAYEADPGYAHALTENIDGTFSIKSPQQNIWNFNSARRLESFVDVSGVQVTLSYNGSGQLTNVTNGLNRDLDFTYLGSRLSEISDGTGRTVAYTFDSDGNLISYSDPLDHTTVYEYQAPGLLTKIYLPANPTVPVTENTYDTLKRIASQKLADTGNYEYYFAGSRSEEIDPRGHSRILYWNNSGSVVKEIDAMNNSVSYAYDGLNRVIRKTFPELNMEETKYDNQNNMIEKRLISKPDSLLDDLVTLFTYDSIWNKVKTIQDPRGNVTNFTYSTTTGVMTRVEKPEIDSEIPTIELTYNARGQVTSITDETGIVTLNIYDSLNEELVSTVKDAGASPHLNLIHQFSYNLVGDCISITDPRGNTTNFEFDAARRRIQRVEALPFGFITNFDYDANDWLTSVERQTNNPLMPWQSFTKEYTTTGKLKLLTDPAGNSVEYFYDSVNKLQAVVDAENRSTEFARDSLDRISTIKNSALNIEVTKTFTANGLSETVMDVRSNTSSYEYDGHDRIKKIIYPDSTFEEFTYDDTNNILSLKTRAGATITSTYDNLNRKVTKTPSGMPTQNMTYDLAGRLKKVATPLDIEQVASGEFEFFYDSAGRFFGEKQPDGKLLTVQLDDNGNRTKVTYPDGYYVDYTYDEINRLTDVVLNGSSAVAVHLDFNALSNRTGLTYENGCSIAYGYEIDDDLHDQTHHFVGSSVTFDYDFDKIHQVKSLEVSDAKFMWNPLTDANTSYAEANNLNQYVSVNSDSFAYDDNGCLVNDGSWTFEYDTLSRLINASTAAAETSFQYDPMDRQSQKSTDTLTRNFVYDGLKRVAEYDENDVLIRRFIYGGGMNEPLIQVDADGTLTYFHQDRQGSLVALSDESGDVSATFAYGPFGEGENLDRPFGYTGQRFDSETGLYYYKSRYYSPRLGRFLQPDSITYSAGLHLYAYVGNSPVTLVDTLGFGTFSFGAAPKPPEVDFAAGQAMTSPAVGASEPEVQYIFTDEAGSPSCKKGGGGKGAKKDWKVPDVWNPDQGYDWSNFESTFQTWLEQFYRQNNIDPARNFEFINAFRHRMVSAALAASGMGATGAEFVGMLHEATGIAITNLLLYLKVAGFGNSGLDPSGRLSADAILRNYPAMIQDTAIDLGNNHIGAKIGVQANGSWSNTVNNVANSVGIPIVGGSAR